MISNAKNYDVFNGDADGLCSLIQLRKEQPCDSVLITGKKRDIRLLERIATAQSADIVVLDIALEANLDALKDLLNQDCRIIYFDHHTTENQPQHAKLELNLDESPGICTSLLVDRWLNGTQGLWSVVGAFGDNLNPKEKLSQLNLTSQEEKVIRLLGEIINYNAYGWTDADLRFNPQDLFKIIMKFDTPFDCMGASPEIEALHRYLLADMHRAERVEPFYSSKTTVIYKLPFKPWAWRAMGAFANKMANINYDKALCVLLQGRGDGFLVSLRVPQQASMGAHHFCRLFGGGGRRTSAGVNWLDASQENDFCAKFKQIYGQ